MDHPNHLDCRLNDFDLCLGFAEGLSLHIGDTSAVVGGIRVDSVCAAAFVLGEGLCQYMRFCLTNFLNLCH